MEVSFRKTRMQIGNPEIVLNTQLILERSLWNDRGQHPLGIQDVLALAEVVLGESKIIRSFVF